MSYYGIVLIKVMTGNINVHIYEIPGENTRSYYKLTGLSNPQSDFDLIIFLLADHNNLSMGGDLSEEQVCPV